MVFRNIACINCSSLQIRHRIESTNKVVQARLKSEKLRLQAKTSQAESAFFESLQTILDHLEQRFEPVMLKPSPDAEKWSTEPSMSMTLSRYDFLSICT